MLNKPNWILLKSHENTEVENYIFRKSGRHLALCFVARNTLYAILKITLIGSSALRTSEKKRSKYQSEPYAISKQSGLGSRLPVPCSTCVLIWITGGKRLWK